LSAVSGATELSLFSVITSWLTVECVRVWTSTPAYLLAAGLVPVQSYVEPGL
jgi:hypothetical protein